ncbi:rho-related GTP-binding protein RhoG-like [Entamoeba marina]
MSFYILAKNGMCLLIGDENIKKTEFITTYFHALNNEIKITNSPDNFKGYLIVDNIEVELSIWFKSNVAQENYEKLRTLSYKDVDVIILCYSINSPTFFENIEKL